MSSDLPRGATLGLLLSVAAQAFAQEAATVTAPDAAPPAAKTEVVAAPKASEPFAFADFTWMPANAGANDRPLTFGPFTGEFRSDAVFHYALSRPKDNTISGSTEAFRSGELQLSQLGVGGDFFYRGAMGRLMTQFGMYSQTTPRNDSSPARGQWNLDNAYRYVSEAYGGYHWDVAHGLNLQAGIFMSYIGLWSYYNADNWTYQPSFVSSNTPWFFNGVRVQYFPTDTLKIEPWLVNGWQSYGRFNHAPGGGGQILWRPTAWLGLVFNNYLGADTLGVPDRMRVHTDDSIMVRYYEGPGVLSRAAASLTIDAGCEWGGGASCSTQHFLGFMAYNRLWFFQNQVGLTVGGGAIDNPGRYLVLLPPINGATAATGSPYFTQNPGDQFQGWDAQITADYSPVPYVTFRVEYTHRWASVPYYSGFESVTPPGGNTGTPSIAVDGWAPGLVPTEDRFTAALMVKI